MYMVVEEMWCAAGDRVLVALYKGKRHDTVKDACDEALRLSMHSSDSTTYGVVTVDGDDRPHTGLRYSQGSEV